MKIQHYRTKTVIQSEETDVFAYVAQTAIDYAVQCGVPTVFYYDGRRTEVQGNEKVSQVYSDYLKRCNKKPTTMAGTLDEILCSLNS